MSTRALAELLVMLGVDDSDLKRGMDDAPKHADRAVSKIGTAFGGLVKTLAKVGVAAGAAAATAAAGLTVTALKDFAAFETQLNEVFTLLPGISGDAMAEMSGQVKDFSKEFGVLPEKVVPALYQALSAGVPKDSVFDFMEVAQKAALGGVTDLETAVNGITGVVNAYGADVITAGQASDLMFTTVRLGKTTFGEMASALGDVTPIAAAMGVSFEEVSAALAASTAITGNTSKSVTGLKGLISELGKEGQIAATNFEKLSGESFPEFIDAGGTLAEALDIMKAGADASGGSIIDMFGSIEAGSAALQLTGSDTFINNIEEMGAAAGATDSAYAQMDQGLSRTWDRIKTTFKVALLDLGEKLAPWVEKFGDWFAEKLPGAIEKTMEWIETKLGPAVSKLVGWFQGGLEKAGGFSGILDKLKGSAGSLTAGLALLGGPLVLIVKELFPLIKPLLDAILPPLAEMANKLAPALGEALGWLTDEILPGLMTMIEAVIGWITDNKGLVVAFGIAMVAFQLLGAVMAVNPFILITAAVIAVASLIITNWDTITAFLKRTWETIKGVASTVWESIKGFFKSAVEFIKNLFLNFTPLGLFIQHMGAMKGAVTGVKDWIVDKFDAVVDFFSGIGSRIGSATSGMWNGIKNAFKAALNWIIDKWNDLSFSLPSFSAFGATIGGGTISTPNIPRFHEGGTFHAPPGLREGLAVLEDGERVTPANGSGSGSQIYIGNVYGYDDFVRKVREAGVDINRLGWQS